MLVEELLLSCGAALNHDRTPVAWLGAAGHEDIGLVFNIVDVKRYKTKFVHHGTVARISYGAGRGGYHPQEKGRWDIDKLGRLHISAYGYRRVFPTDWETLGISEDQSVENIVHVPLRWIDGQFDTSLTGDKNYAHTPTRTCFLLSEATRKKNDEFPEFPRRENRLPLSEIRPGGFGKRDAAYPTIGYQPALEFLSQFGTVSSGDAIPRMDMKQGVEYFITELLPAVHAFSRS